MADDNVTPISEAPPAKEITVVLLGNSAPMMQAKQQIGVDDQGNPVHQNISVLAKHINQSVTRVEMQPDYADQEHVDLALSTDNDRFLSLIARALPDEHKLYAIGIQHLEQILPVHSGKSKPDWVACNDPKFEEAIAQYYNCPRGEPQNLLTNAGRDAIHAQHLGTSAQPAACNYMALGDNASTTAPAAGNTTLAGEITTAGGGLIRKQATYAHTTGTNTSTLTATFTANGSDTLPVTVSQMAIFNASSAGTMAYKTVLNANATLTISGDNTTVTETVTGG